MNTFLKTIGWWNFGGSICMLFFLYEPFGQAVLNTSTKIFKEKFVLSYWTKLWLGWAAGINIFFGLINVMAARWNFNELKVFMTSADIVAYSVFFLLAIWGHAEKKMGPGVWSVYIIFGGWIGWAIYALLNFTGV